MPSSAPTVSLADRLATLPQFYTHRTLLEDVFDNDEDAFIDAWVSGLLPRGVRAVVWDGGAQWLNTLLLARLCRLQLALLATQDILAHGQQEMLAAIDKLNAPWETPPETPA